MSSDSDKFKIVIFKHSLKLYFFLQYLDTVIIWCLWYAMELLV